MSEILKYKGLMGTDNVELELPLDMTGSGDEIQRDLIETFMKWLSHRINQLD